MTTPTRPRRPRKVPAPIVAPVAAINPWSFDVDPRSLPLCMGSQAMVEALDEAAALLLASHGDPGIGSVVRAAANDLRRFYYERQVWRERGER